MNSAAEPAPSSLKHPHLESESGRGEDEGDPIVATYVDTVRV